MVKAPTPETSVILIQYSITSLTSHASNRVKIIIQGHPERMSKVNPFAQALIFTKSGFSEVFWDEK